MDHRYYDECGETIDCFLDFFSLGIPTALNDAMATWLWTNSNLWSGTNYNYALNWPGYECEAGGFLQIALKLLSDNSSMPDTSNLLCDIENRFLAEQFSSPQWLDGVVCHMAANNPQLRLENTVMAWAAILGSYGELTSIYQIDVQDMLMGTGGTATPAWQQLLQSSLCAALTFHICLSTLTILDQATTLQLQEPTYCSCLGLFRKPQPSLCL